jgi:hypothetical protein
VIEILPHVTRIASAAGDWHCIIFSNLPANNADAVIEEQAEYFRRRGASVEWKAFAHDGPTDLIRRLGAHGFEIGPEETVLVLDLQERPAWIGDSTFRVHSVRTMDEVDLYRRIATEIFQKDYRLTARELASAIRGGSTEHVGYIAYDGAVAASIGRLYTHRQSEFGGLYGGATLEAHRGRGLYRAVVAARARDALEHGVQYLIVDALPTSHPILEQLGFVPLTTTWPCTLKVEKHP